MILDGMSSQACPVNAAVSQGFISELSLSLLDITAFPDDIICNTIIYGNNINLYFNHVQASGLGQPLRLVSDLTYNTLWTEDRSGLLISMQEKFKLFFFLMVRIALVLLK